MIPICRLCYFFFQAEDGIRDLIVTWSSDVCSSDLAGALVPAPPACAAEGTMRCVADGTQYRAAALAGLAGAIVSGHTVAGVAGTAPARPADCSEIGRASCRERVSCRRGWRGGKQNV